MIGWANVFKQKPETVGRGKNFKCSIATSLDAPVGMVFGISVPPVAASHKGPSGALVVILQLFIFDGAGHFSPPLSLLLYLEGFFPPLCSL